MQDPKAKPLTPSRDDTTWITALAWRTAKRARKPRKPRTAKQWKAARATMGRRNPTTEARNNCGICHGSGKRKHLKSRDATGRPSYRTTYCRCDIKASDLAEMRGRSLLRPRAARKPAPVVSTFRPHWLPGRAPCDRLGRGGSLVDPPNLFAMTSHERNRARRRRQRQGGV